MGTDFKLGDTTICDLLLFKASADITKSDSNTWRIYVTWFLNEPVNIFVEDLLTFASKKSEIPKLNKCFELKFSFLTRKFLLGVVRKLVHAKNWIFKFPCRKSSNIVDKILFLFV